ncbi:hypothetical protein PG993_005504 [Apiospora rasikravindrae]|uniref:Uncharacterized protein n=1 Tax=Apiospora rasikravindrae TaxID=990691 RepID=A0ABR1TFR4_9PEZI
MSHTPMVLTSESAKSRRREISKIVIEECHQRGDTLSCVKQELLPWIIEESEIELLEWMRDLDPTEYIRRTALAGVMSEDYAAWMTDLLVWDWIKGVTRHHMTSLRKPFFEMFPEPEIYQRPWTNWFREAADAAQRAPSETLESLKMEESRLEAELHVKQAEYDQLREGLEKESTI